MLQTEWVPPTRIRVTAMGIITKNSAVLVQRGYDRIKNEDFYRLIGGTVEFQEKTTDTLVREFREELGIAIHVDRALGVLENIFTYRGHPGHEYVHIIKAAFADPLLLEQSEFLLKESSGKKTTAFWEELNILLSPQTRFYPHGIQSLLKSEINL